MNKVFKVLLPVFLGIISISQDSHAQCSFLSGNTIDNFSTGSVICAPVTVSWNIQYSFIAPVDPSKVLFRFEWNDPASTVTDVQGTCSGLNCFPSSGTQQFTYPSTGNDCEYFPKVTLAYDVNGNGLIDLGELCPSSVINKSIRSWNTDNSGTGMLAVSPSLTEQCVGEALNAYQIQDATFPNCGSVSLSNPNQLTRWVQFVYGDPSQPGPQIPGITLDSAGVNIPVTDASGNLIRQYFGPVIEIPALVTPADLDELSYPLSSSSNTTIGESFKIYLRNWNICNPYDSLPFDGNAPSDPVNGDNTPEVVFSEINVIGPTVAQAGPDQEVCGNSTFMSANTAIDGLGRWQQISGPGTLSINNVNSENTAINFSGNNYGTYLLEWSIDFKSCISRDTVEVLFNPPPTTPVCGPDQSICGLSSNLMANPITVGIGYWVQISGPTGLIINDSTNPISLVSAPNYGSYTLEWRSQNANCPIKSDQIQVNFFEEPQISNAGPDLSNCGTSVTLNATIPTIGSGIWSVISSPAGSNNSFSNIGSASSTFQSSTFGVFILEWTVSNGVCPERLDTVIVTLNPPPSTSNAGPDFGTCGLSATLSANNPGSGTGVWRNVSGPASAIVNFTDSLNPNSGVSVSTFGTYVFEWEISNSNCPVSTDQVQIDFYNNPDTAHAGPDQNVCGNGTVLAADPISTGTGQWSILSSPAGSNPVIQNPSIRNSTFTSDSFGVYTLLWTVSSGLCSSNSDTVHITFNKSPGQPIAGNDQSLCALTANLFGNSPLAGTGLWAQVAGPSGLVINSPNSPITSITATNYGTYLLEWRFSNGSCPMVSDQVQIIFSANPTPAFAGQDTFVCGNVTSLNANNLNIGMGQWSLISKPNGSTYNLSNIADPNSGLSVDSFGVYVFKWTSSNGACNSSEDNVRITFAEKPQLIISSQTATRCFGTCDGAASLQGVKGLPPYFYTWTGTDSREGAAFTDLCSGNYQVTISDKNGCQNSSTLTIQQPDSISAVATVSNSSCGNFDGSINLSAIGGTGNLNFKWNTGSISQNISNIPAGLYVASIRDTNNCLEMISAIVNDINAPVLSTNSVTPVSCNGSRNGAIDISATGQNNTFLWSNGASTEDISNLEAGPYFVMAQNTAGCKSFRQIYVPEPDEINLRVNITKPTCGQADGIAQVLINGGNGSNNISWSTGGTGSSINGLVAGIYSVTVIDSKGCFKNKNFAVSDRGAPLVFTDSVQNVTCNSNNGAIYVSTTGNSGIYNYSWSSGDTTEDITNLGVGTYNLQVTDTIGCKAFYTRDIIQVTGINPEICMVTVGTLDSGASGNNNVILWEKLSDPDAYDEFRIYRETTSAGVYQQIGSVSAKVPGRFTDPISNPLFKSYRYKISVVDTCGIESALSDYHKTIHLLQFPLLQNNTIGLFWDDYEGFAYSTYYIYRNSQANAWELIDSISSNNNTYTDTFNVLDPDLFYTIEINSPRDCDPNKGDDYSRSRSNRSSALFSIIGLENELSENDILIYPVPVEDVVNIETKTQIPFILKIIDLNGKTRLTGYINKDLNSVDLSGLSSGYYLLEISNSSGFFRKGIIKK